MRMGHQSWVFDQHRPVIVSAGTVVGPFEGEGPLAGDFDTIHGDMWIGQDSWEKAEKRLLEEACEKAIEKSGLLKEHIQFFVGGDLMSQIISSSFAARTLGLPYLGIFAACATSMEGLALSAMMVDSGNARSVICGTSSHNAAAEKQYRYPTEYGGQKPDTAQWTVTGAGAVIVQPEHEPVADQTMPLRVRSATVGRIVDMGLSDPFNMGAAMAPAAVDTITAHFRDLDTGFHDFDLILTGDLGQVGHRLALELFQKHGFGDPGEKFQDCGMLIYGDRPETLAGASGCASSATVTFGHIFKRMVHGELNSVLVAATGALLSPISYQQKESIPCICHAVAIERVMEP